LDNKAVEMIAGIVGVPERFKYIQDLRRVLSAEVDNVTVFMDVNKNGQAWNVPRTISECVKKAKKDEPVLICTDDAITVPGWRNYWEKIHAKAKNNTYIFMANRKHLFTQDNIARGYVTKCDPKGFFDHAMLFINQPDFVERVDNWFDNQGGRELLGKRGRWYDVRMQGYINHIKKEYTITIPTLFNHRPIKSTYGNKIQGSKLYIGDLENFPKI
jgi:hypothetical protein